MPDDLIILSHFLMEQEHAIKLLEAVMHELFQPCGVFPHQNSGKATKNGALSFLYTPELWKRVYTFLFTVLV